MALNRCKLGDLIEVREFKNSDEKYGLENVKGISIQKKFIETKADMTGVSLKPYLIVEPNDFCYVTVTSRNGEKISLSMNDSNETYIVSSSYVVFRVKDKSILNPYYLFMYFNRPEFDRYSRFNSWGSARETFDYSELCDIDFEYPSIDIQQKYVDIYTSMIENQKSYEIGLDDLKLVCDVFIEGLRRTNTCIRIGEYLFETKNKNEKAEILPNRSVSNAKVFIDAKETVVNGVDTKNYLLVEPYDFAYNTVTTRNADKLSIALNASERCLVSPLYTTFRVAKEGLVPEYLCLWFNRSEYDRYARFKSWGSARELYPFETLANTKIPIPDITIQESIVNIYNSYTERRDINEKLKAQIKDICPILIKGSIEEARRTKES